MSCIAFMCFLLLLCFLFSLLLLMSLMMCICRILIKITYLSKLSCDVTTTWVNSAFQLSGVAKSSSSFGWGKGVKIATAGWQVTLCDPKWHVILRSSEMIQTTLLYLLY